MEVLRRTVGGSPFVGVFMVLTDDFAVVPGNSEKKEIAGMEEKLGARVVKGTVAGCFLWGVFGMGLGNKLLLPEFALEREIRELEKNKIETMVVKGYSALGNLFAGNSRGGFASTMVDEKTVKEAGKFLGIKMKREKLLSSDLPGAEIAVSEKGFLVHPEISEAKFRLLEKTFGVSGSATTANFGDPFVGNDIVANSRGAVIGAQTSGHELIRIDEGLRGD